MNARTCVIVAAFILVASAPAPAENAARGVRVLQQHGVAPQPRSFDARESAALFVGVRKFRDDTTIEVPFAADDAVDLAYMFALDHRLRLVAPSRVVLALGGRPSKEESKRKLNELVREGAVVKSAETENIRVLLQQQAALATRNGILIVSIATHGFVRDGIPYILGSNSIFRFPNTAVPAPELFDIASKSDAPRSLFFIDACRERMSETERAAASRETAAPWISRMGRTNGQVVFYAAAAGGYAYDDDASGNGVFTKAVIDGLSCNAALVRNAVTVETLHTYVERSVRSWIRQHRNAAIRFATQVSLDGDSKNIPLATCGGPPPPPPPGDVARAKHEGAKVSAFGADGAPLWTRSAGAAVERISVEDLNGDGSHEVIVGTATSLEVFDRAGTLLWSSADGGKLRAFRTGPLLRRDGTQQLAALWDRRIDTYNAGGQRLSTFEFDGDLRQIEIDRPTSRHKWRIIASGSSTLLVLDSKGVLEWKATLHPESERIARVQVVQRDKHEREIRVSTNEGHVIHVDFDGSMLASSSHAVRLVKMSRRAKLKASTPTSPRQAHRARSSGASSRR